MTTSKILSFLAPCLFGFAACGGSDLEPPLTPAAYTPHRSNKAAPRAPRAASPSPQAQKRPQLAREAPPPVVTGTQGDDAKTAIALARCQREARCSNVGEDKEYVTEDDCVTRLEPNTERELEARECPSRISPVPLEACMQAIRRQSCDSPRDLARINECSAAVLCQK